MVVSYFQKKVVYWLAFFLCIFSIGSASTSLGYEPTGKPQQVLIIRSPAVSQTKSQRP